MLPRRLPPQVINEKEALETLNSPGHPNLIRLHAAFRDAQCLYLVLELAPGGELFEHIRRLGACSLLCARWLSAELINALEYMHGRCAPPCPFSFW
jgi:3-phosphoinositide dependent protein kinase-1